MTITSPNPAPRFATAVEPWFSTDQDPLILVDIGTRGGFPAQWHPLRNIAKLIGFEPEQGECARLNDLLKSQGNVNHLIYPYAIAGTTGRHKFYVTRFLQSSGLYPTNRDWIERFPFQTLDVIGETEVDAYSLDDFCRTQKVNRIDFIKLDVEGAEYDVLTGATECLSRTPNILGMITEVWWDPVVKGQHSFAEIDIFLRHHGFRLFDLKLDRYSRSTLSAGRLHGGADSKGFMHISHSEYLTYGQVMTGDALYFRDPVGEARAGKLDPAWDAAALLRLCTLLDLYDYSDCTLEIIEYFADSLLIDYEISPLIDAAVPLLNNHMVPYDIYRFASNCYRDNINTSEYGLPGWVPPETHYRR